MDRDKRGVREEERAKGEKGVEERRITSIMWRGVDGADKEIRRGIIRERARIVTGKRVIFNRMRDRIGEGGRRRVITESRRKEDREALLGKGERYGEDGR